MEINSKRDDGEWRFYLHGKYVGYIKNDGGHYIVKLKTFFQADNLHLIVGEFVTLKQAKDYVRGLKTWRQFRTHLVNTFEMKISTALKTHLHES